MAKQQRAIDTDEVVRRSIKTRYRLEGWKGVPLADYQDLTRENDPFVEHWSARDDKAPLMPSGRYDKANPGKVLSETYRQYENIGVSLGETVHQNAGSSIQIRQRTEAEPV